MLRKRDAGASTGDFFGGRHIGADVRNPTCDKVAELFGAAGCRVDKQARAGDALRAPLACGKPASVDAMIDPDVLCSFRRDALAHCVERATTRQ
jgi:thiamine pyrophosphate-dependent acetolactate synthase large subunit-like protein